MVSASQSPMRLFGRHGGSVFYADAVGHFASGPCAAVAFAVGFAAYSEVLPQSAAVAFVLAEVAVNGAVMERDPVVRCLVSRLYRCAFSALYCCPWVQCRLISRLMVLLWRLSCLAISAMVQWRDRYWIWYRSSWVSCVAHGNLSCRKGRMLPHTGLFLLWKVALQM